MKYTIKPSNRFKKELNKIIKRGYDKTLIMEVISLLANGVELPQKNKDHALKGDYNGYRECHITPDWLLIYQIDNNDLFLYLTRTGSHSDLF